MSRDFDDGFGAGYEACRRQLEVENEHNRVGRCGNDTWRVMCDGVDIPLVRKYALVEAEQRLAAAEACVESHAILLNQFAGHVQKAKAERDELSRECVSLDMALSEAEGEVTRLKHDNAYLVTMRQERDSALSRVRELEQARDSALAKFMEYED